MESEQTKIEGHYSDDEELFEPHHRNSNDPSLQDSLRYSIASRPSWTYPQQLRGSTASSFGSFYFQPGPVETGSVSLVLLRLVCVFIREHLQTGTALHMHK
jgi:hypothetical protein